jgi:hypothetical protein
MWLQLLRKSNAAGPRRAAARAAIEAPRIATLSLAALERLAPAGHIKTAYPHIWERISLFCHDPAHLEKYLVSLSIQARDGKRAGLRQEAVGEIADILGANQRFVIVPPAAGTGWDSASLMR